MNDTDRTRASTAGVLPGIVPNSDTSLPDSSHEHTSTGTSDNLDSTPPVASLDSADVLSHLEQLRRADVGPSELDSVSSASHLEMDDLSKAQLLALKTIDKLHVIAGTVYDTAKNDMAKTDESSRSQQDKNEHESKNLIRHRLENDNLKIEKDAATLHKVMGMMVLWRMAYFKEQKRLKQEAEAIQNLNVIARWHNPTRIPMQFPHGVTINPRTILQPRTLPPRTSQPMNPPSMTPQQMNPYMMPHGVVPNVYGNQYNINNHRTPVAHGHYIYNSADVYGGQVPLDYSHLGPYGGHFFGQVNI